MLVISLDVFERTDHAAEIRNSQLANAELPTFN